MTTRAEAALALFAAGLAIVALVFLGWRDFGAVVVAVVAVAVAAAGGWVALTRRGGMRVLGVVVAAVALVGGGLTLVLTGAVGELALLLAALVAFSLAASAALARQDERDVAEQHAPRRATVRQAVGAVLLMNPRSGGGKVERFDLVAEARRRGIEPVVLGPDDDLHSLAVEAAHRAEVIGMAGGDGSQALVAQVAMEHDVEFVCIPAGTRNHLALDLGLDRDDVVGALDAFSSRGHRTIDLGLVNGRVFVNNVSLGLYAEVVQSERYRDAKRETLLELGPELLGSDATPFDLRFRTPDGEEHPTAQLVLVSNNPYVLDRLAGVGSRPALDTGTLGVLALVVRSAAEAGELAALEAAGQARRFRGWHQWSAQAFEIASGDDVPAGVDGEAELLRPPLRFTVVPGAVTVRLPPGAGRSPAAAAPAFRRSTFGELWQTAAGRRSRAR